MKMDAGKLREAVNRGAPDVPIDWRAAAADLVIEERRESGGPLSFTKADVRRVVERARWLARIARASDAISEQTSPLEPTPFVRNLVADWLEALEPLVRRGRERAFGSGEAPFRSDDYASAVLWIEREVDQLPQRPAPTDEAIRFEIEALTKIREQQGPGISLHREYFEIEYYKADGSPWRRTLPVDEPPSAVEVGLEVDSPPIAILAKVANEIARVTGFLRPDITTYLLCGVPPTLRRAVVLLDSQSTPVPDPKRGAAQATGTQVVVRLRSPDLTWRDLQALYEEIRDAWRRAGVRLPNGGGPQRPRLTPNDERLLRVVEELGGIPEEHGPEWWGRVARQWKEKGYSPRKPDSHRRHWERLEQKRSRFTLSLELVKEPADERLPATIDLPRREDTDGEA